MSAFLRKLILYGYVYDVKYIDYKGNEKLRTFWKGSLARNDFPQGAETDIVFSSKPVSFKNNPSLAKRLSANTCDIYTKTDEIDGKPDTATSCKSGFGASPWKPTVVIR